MKARVNIARVVSYFDAVGEIADPSLFLGEVLDSSGVKVKDLTFSQVGSAPNLLLSSSFIIQISGQYKVVYKLSGVVKLVEYLDVGRYPLTDFPISTAVDLLLDDAIAGGQGETVTAVVVTSAGADLNTPASTSAPFDAATSAYKLSQTFSAEGTYYIVWHKLVGLAVTPFYVDEVFVARRFGFEKVEFIVATLAGNNGTPHTGATLYISNSDGSPVAQAVVEADGSAEMEMEPGSYVGTLSKSGVFYSNNNVAVKVVDTLDVDPAEGQLNNIFQFITDSFTPTITPLSAPASTCSLFADLYRMDGQPLVNAEVMVSLLHKPELYSGKAVFDTRKVFKTDHNGHVEFDLVQGLQIEVSIAPLSLRRIITVPSESGPTNILTLLSGADDPFDVITPNIPAAPRRTL